MKIPPEDIAVYVYKESDAMAREDRLPHCAAAYADWRGLAGGDFSVQHQPKGKPYFPQQPGIHFSVSHSGGYWLAAFHGAPVGLDIQQHKLRDYMAIAKRWYHADEYALVEQQGEACFFNIWSAKESLCKVEGQGIDSSFARFSVVAGDKLAACCQGLRLYPLLLLEGYSACLCSRQINQVHIITA